MGSGPTGIAGRFRGRTIAGKEMREQPLQRATALRHRSFITLLPVIERKTRERAGIEKEEGTEERRENGMEATWLPTAIRGGGRHESHDDVTATMATGRRGQSVSLPELRAVPSARS